jgi:hypothetical protein
MSNEPDRASGGVRRDLPTMESGARSQYEGCLIRQRR